MGIVEIEEIEHGFVLKNVDFEIWVSKNGSVKSLSIVNSGYNIICDTSFVLNIPGELSEPFISQLSSLVSFEFDTDFGEIKRIFTIKEQAVVVDDILISTEEGQVDYKLSFCFEDCDYFMVGKNCFDMEKAVSINANDLLLVNEKRDIYFGCIFKELMELNFAKDKKPNFELLKKISLNKADMFMFSYTFSLV